MFFSKKPDPGQPNPKWPWSLSEGGTPRTDFNLQTIESDLILLYQDNDSFIILEQKDPKDSKQYWYIQSAIALAGPDQGKYIVDVGYPGPDGPLMFERLEDSAEAVLPWFRAALEGRKIDLSQFKVVHL